MYAWSALIQIESSKFGYNSLEKHTTLRAWFLKRNEIFGASTQSCNLQKRVFCFTHAKMFDWGSFAAEEWNQFWQNLATVCHRLPGGMLKHFRRFLAETRWGNCCTNDLHKSIRRPAKAWNVELVDAACYENLANWCSDWLIGLLFHINQLINKSNTKSHRAIRRPIVSEH